MSKPRKSAGKGKRKGKPQRKSGPHTKQTQKAKSDRVASRSGRGSGRGSKPSRRSSSSSSDDEPAPASASAPGDDSSDAGSSDGDELDPRLKREYHPEAMLAQRARLREEVRRSRMGRSRRKKANKEPLPVVPADPFPPQFGGFPTDWPDDGTFPPWFAEKAKAMGHDLDDARNVAALQKMVEACRRVNMRPLMQGRYISPTRAIKNFVILAEREDGERAAELKAAAESLKELRSQCQRNARPAEPPKGCCRMCGVVGAVLRENQPVVRGPPRRRADAITGVASMAWGLLLI